MSRRTPKICVRYEQSSDSLHDLEVENAAPIRGNTEDDHDDCKGDILLTPWIDVKFVRDT